MKCKYMIRSLYYTCSRPCQRSVSTTSVVQLFKGKVKINEEDEQSSSDHNPSVKPTKHYNHINDFFNSKEHLKVIKEKIPPECLIRTYKSYSLMYCVDRDVASKSLACLNIIKLLNKNHIIIFKKTWL